MSKTKRLTESGMLIALSLCLMHVFLNRHRGGDGMSWSASRLAKSIKDGIWSITYTNVPAGEYELKVTAGSWDNNWGANGAANGENVKITVAEAGDVTIKFNPATNWISAYNGNNPLTNDVSLAGIGIALLAATAGVVALVGKKKED